MQTVSTTPKKSKCLIMCIFVAMIILIALNMYSLILFALYVAFLATMFFAIFVIKEITQKIIPCLFIIAFSIVFYLLS
jgi:hypothetical protein